MVWASFIVAMLGVLIGACGLGWTVYRDRKHTAALDQERAERKESDELAQLTAEGGGNSGSSRGIEHTIRVRNLGPAPARDVYVWLTEKYPDYLAGAMTQQEHIVALVPSDGWVTIQLPQPGPLGGRTQRGGVIVANWTDGNRTHKDQIIGQAPVFR